MEPTDLFHTKHVLLFGLRGVTVPHPKCVSPLWVLRVVGMGSDCGRTERQNGMARNGGSQGPRYIVRVEKRGSSADKGQVGARAE